MATKTIEEQLLALIPKNLDDVIRKHRDQASLRISTEADLQPLSRTMQPTADGSTLGLLAANITLWNFITLDAHTSDADWRRYVLLFGWNESQRRTWNTSPVVQLDAAAGLVLTRSGSLYRVAGPQGAEKDIDLLHLCVYLHQTQAGRYLGVPEIFY